MCNPGWAGQNCSSQVTCQFWDEELEAGGARVKGADGLWAVQNIRSAHSRSADIDTKFTQPNWKLHDIGTGSTLEPWLKAMLAEMHLAMNEEIRT